MMSLTMKLYKKIKNLLKQNYLYHRNLQFKKFIKISPSVFHHFTPANLFPQPPHSGWGNTTH